MPSRLIRILPNGRMVTRGLGAEDGRHRAMQDSEEVDVYRVDFDLWLESGETIASSAIAGSPTFVKTDGSTYVDLTVSGATGIHDADLLVTTSTGRKKMVRLRFDVPEIMARPDAYDWAGP